ncbi:MAG: ferrous iron transport protein B [Candidatus Zixiibacteriota bacterium]|nr:MAG: ferrous iron transport protein B [candidate division Zixibacteria bacterium]
MSNQNAAGNVISESTIAICGNPNCGKTTIFNAITGLNQRVGNYPGVTVEKVSGTFSVDSTNKHSFTLVDIPGTYSLSAFSPDEDIAVSALIGSLKDAKSPDGIICVLDATNLERSFAFLLQVIEIGRPIVVAVNMVDLVERRGLKINFEKMSQSLGGIPVVPVIGNRRVGIEELKKAAADLPNRKPITVGTNYGPEAEKLFERLVNESNNGHRNRAEYLRVIFDANSPAEERFLLEEPDLMEVLREGQSRIKEVHGSLSLTETAVLSEKAATLFQEIVTIVRPPKTRNSERIDRVLLHPVFGPIILLLTMIIVFQSIFSWSEPLMNLIDSSFSWLASQVEAVMSPGPLQSLLTDGIIGGVGSVLIFLPQIVILFLFIAILEDSGYMTRAAFLVDRLFRWCGLSGKSFIPLLSSFACSIPGILATRTIEDRKLRYITIMVAPLMTCSARLPIYAIMIAAFIPHKTYLGILNLQGIVLSSLYLLGIVVAVIVSFILKKVIFKTERGTFLMELPSYKIPTVHSVSIRVLNRAKSFLLRAGTVILAITIIIWALSYFPHDGKITHQFASQAETARFELKESTQIYSSRLDNFYESAPVDVRSAVDDIRESFSVGNNIEDFTLIRSQMNEQHNELYGPIEALYEIQRQELATETALTELKNLEAGAYLRNSLLARIGKTLEPAFKPLGWDWKITMAILAAFPAREVAIATIGTIYNLGTETDEESLSLIDKMRQARWDDGPRQGEFVFTPAVALSIMVFFALCLQCGATVVTIRKETSSWWYAWGTFTYMTVLAYVAALGVYQLLERFIY